MTMSLCRRLIDQAVWSPSPLRGRGVRGEGAAPSDAASPSPPAPLPRRGEGGMLDLNAMPLTDKKTYELLQRGDSRGVFQLESDGIRELLKRMRPDNIRDLIATNALYRPGPLSGGMVDAYVNRKHGRERPTYAHPVMEEILKETYGVIVYQEQCMRVLNRLG